MAKTVVGSFDSYSEAQSVVEELVNIGVPRDEISIVANDTAGRYSEGRTDTSGTASGAGKGAVVGGAIGGAAGLAAGLAGLAIPGIGPIIAAGPIAAALAGAGAGAVAGGLIGGLTHLGVSEEDAHVYAESVRRGGALVTVRAEENTAERAAEVMRNHNAVDVDRRAEEWKRGGWSGFDANAQPYSAQNDIERDRQTVLPVVEEELNVGKRQVQRGGVRVNARMTEQPVEEQVRLREEHARVERRPVDRPATEADLAAFKEGTIEVRESAEEAVVAKQARVVEEVIVGKEVSERTDTVSDTVRRTEVDVDRVGSGRLSGSPAGANDPFRTHYQTHYASTGRAYDEYAPAYQYGSTLRSDARYSGRDWSTIEPEARRDWEASHRGSPWENFKDAVRHGWESVTGRR
jgi:uncharacterized protein (TIGR02271 family)